MDSESDQSFKDGDEKVESDRELDEEESEDNEEVSCEEENTVTGKAMSDIEWIEKKHFRIERIRNRTICD